MKLSPAEQRENKRKEANKPHTNDSQYSPYELMLARQIRSEQCQQN